MSTDRGGGGGALVLKRNELIENRKKYDLSRPSNEIREARIRATREAIDQLIAAALDQTDAPRVKKPAAEYKSIEYQPQGSAQSLSLKIVEQQSDPLEPPRHRYQKPKPFEEGAVANYETRAPILRPEPKPLTKEEKAQWKIPQSISNWKNERGYLIDLEHRAAASAKPSAVMNDNKQGSLADALAQAAAEVEEEGRETQITDEERRQALRRKLLEQKNKDSKELKNPQGDEELDPDEQIFDSRLFHSASKRRHDDFNESLKTRKPKRPAVEFHS